MCFYSLSIACSVIILVVCALTVVEFRDAECDEPLRTFIWGLVGFNITHLIWWCMPTSDCAEKMAGPKVKRNRFQRKLPSRQSNSGRKRWGRHNETSQGSHCADDEEAGGADGQNDGLQEDTVPLDPVEELERIKRVEKLDKGML